MSQDMRCRPSSLMGVADPLVAFYADRAAWTFANAINSEMEAAVTRLPKNAKDSAHQRAKQRVLDQFLGFTEEAKAPGRFRAPKITR
jgi:hypothetical protein